MDEYSWASAVGRIRVLEQRLLAEPEMRQFAESRSLQGALAALRDSLYGPYLEKLQDPGDFDQALEQALSDEYKMLMGMSPEPQAIMVFRARYDFHNLKVVARSNLLGMPWEEQAVSRMGNIIPGHVVELFAEEKSVTDPGQRYARGTAFLAGQPNIYVPNPTLASLLKGLLDAYDCVHAQDPLPSEPAAGLQMDADIDRAYYRWAAREIRRLGYGGLTMFFASEIDVLNLRMAVRAMRLGIPGALAGSLFLDGGRVEAQAVYGEYLNGLKGLKALYGRTPWADLAEEGVLLLERGGPLSGWERRSDNAFMGFLRKARYQALGPEPVFGYLYGRETEVRNLRVILSGKASGVLAQEILERLREPYV